MGARRVRVAWVGIRLIWWELNTSGKGNCVLPSLRVAWGRSGVDTSVNAARTSKCATSALAGDHWERL
jgi:hypothetical protein